MPNLIILDTAPPQRNVIELIEYFRQDLAALNRVPLVCLCTSRGENMVLRIGIEAKNVLNKPFELEDLYFQLSELLAEEPTIKQSKSMPEQTLVFPEIEPCSSIKEQEYWLKVFQEHSEQDAWELLMAAGYEVKVPMSLTEE